MRLSPKVKNFLYILGIIIIFIIVIVVNDFTPSFLKIRKSKMLIDNVVKKFPFSTENSLKEWEEKVLRGKVRYFIEDTNKDENLSYVRAESDNTASALYYKVKMDMEHKPVISWKWRVDKFPEKKLPESIEGTKEEDFAARVYVIFPAAFFTNSKVIEYIWAEDLPRGTSGRSGYSKNIKVLVLEQGRSEQWQEEKRNIYDDYIKLFGEDPELDIGAIAFMTDADSTGTTANAVYDEIRIGYQ